MMMDALNKDGLRKNMLILRAGKRKCKRSVNYDFFQNTKQNNV
jgi:hypothetical protein